MREREREGRRDKERNGSSHGVCATIAHGSTSRMTHTSPMGGRKRQGKPDWGKKHAAQTTSTD